METIYSISQARGKFSELVNGVIYGGENVKISRGKSKKPVAVIISAEEWEAYEAWCDSQDAKSAKNILREMERTGEKGRPAAEVWRELGLE